MVQIHDQIVEIEDKINSRRNFVHNELRPKLIVSQNSLEQTSEKMTQVQTALKLFTKKIDQSQQEIEELMTHMLSIEKKIDQRDKITTIQEGMK